MKKQEKTEEKNEFVDMMVRKAFSQDTKPEPYTPKITTNKDPELQPHKDSVNIEEIEELAERLKANLVKRK